MSGEKKTKGDKRMLQASGHFAAGRYSKADNDYAAAVLDYEKESPPRADRIALALFTRAHLRLKGLAPGEASDVIAAGLAHTSDSSDKVLRRFHALFHLQAAAQSRLNGEIQKARTCLRESESLLKKDGQPNDQFELFHENALVCVEEREFEAALTAARGTLDRAQHPEQRLTAHFLVATCKEAAGDLEGALSSFVRAEAVTYDHKIKDGPENLKRLRQEFMNRHPDRGGSVDDSEWL